MKRIVMVGVSVLAAVSLSACSGTATTEPTPTPSATASASSSSEASPTPKSPDLRVIEGFEPGENGLISRVDTTGSIGDHQGVKVTLDRPYQKATFQFIDPANSQPTGELALFNYVGHTFVWQHPVKEGSDEKITLNMNLSNDELVGVFDNSNADISDKVRADGKWNEMQDQVRAMRDDIDAYFQKNYGMNVEEATVSKA